MKKGLKYKVYDNGDIYDGNHLIGVIDGLVLDYVMQNPWMSSGQKKKLDRLIEGRPESFEEILKKKDAMSLMVEQIFSKNAVEVTPGFIYRIENADKCTEDFLNKLGQDWWKLIFVYENRFYFRKYN